MIVETEEMIMGFMFYIWLGIMVLAIIIEISTTDLTSFWFALGALGALIVSIFTDNDLWYVQVIVFSILTILSIIFVRPLFKKKFDSPKIATNIDAMMGKIAIVESAIALNQPGSVKYEGIEWTAVTEQVGFEPGDLVEIVKVEGNTLTVQKVK